MWAIGSLKLSMLLPSVHAVKVIKLQIFVVGLWAFWKIAALEMDNDVDRYTQASFHEHSKVDHWSIA